MIAIEIPDDDLNAWLTELKPYQQSSLKIMLESHDPEETAQLWVTADGSGNTIHFGGTSNPKPFWDNLKKEFNKFICDERAYQTEKQELNEHGNISKGILISVISAALGATLGISATLLAPAIVLLLFLVGKMTRNAYCATYYSDTNGHQDS